MCSTIRTSLSLHFYLSAYHIPLLPLSVEIRTGRCQARFCFHRDNPSPPFPPAWTFLSGAHTITQPSSWACLVDFYMFNKCTSLGPNTPYFTLVGKSLPHTFEILVGFSLTLWPVFIHNTGQIYYSYTRSALFQYSDRDYTIF